MENKKLSKEALEIIDQYTNFKIGQATCSVPYFNNKTKKRRAAFRTYIGKGSPQDIREELETIITKNKIDRNSLTKDSLKKILIDNNLGIECSGFCYYILNNESQARRLGQIKRKINFINCNNLIDKIRCYIRPIENCNVETFADNSNSKIISLEKITPGDIITIISNEKERNHIMIIKEVQYEKNTPKKIIYSHSIAYPEDGIVGTGVRDGQIIINDINLPITKAIWIEQEKENFDNPLFIRAVNSKTEIRRLNWF